ncbi:MAG TPA: hypothetical protein VMW72_17310 [Sedimentisphaerales bacterium]|nr:hypothetical protein [Sedimentisphaerales bacterium]
MKKKNHIKMRFSTLLFCCLAIVLCAAPRGWADGSYKLYDGGEIYDLDDGEIYDVTEDLYWLEVGAGTTVNLRCASVKLYVYAYPGSILNIYSGNVEWYVLVKPAMATGSSEPEAVVTVYGKDFKVDGDSVSYGPIVIDSLSNGIFGGILTGIYGNLESIELKFISIVPIPILLEPPAVSEVEIQIDIKPGSDLNNINLKSKGVVPVAVLTTEDFDASTIDTDPDTDTVKLAGASPVRWKLCDVDGDGDLDMLFHFKTQELLKNEKNPDGLDEGSTEATLTATLIGSRETTDGEVVIQGTDEVCIKPQKKKK